MPINAKQSDGDVLGVVTDKGGWTNKHYGIRQTNRGDTFWAPRSYIIKLKARGMADFYRGPSETKPAGPSLTKKHIGGGWYAISDGEKVQGKAAADKYIEENS